MTTATIPMLDIEIEAIDSVVADADWKLQAACRGQIELFFARKAERPQARERREAKAKKMCDVCPVSTECRTTARENREYGYWAGESEEDRHLIVTCSASESLLPSAYALASPTSKSGRAAAPELRQVIAEARSSTRRCRLGGSSPGR